MPSWKPLNIEINCDWQCFDNLLEFRMIWPCICNKIGEMQWTQFEFASKNVSSDPDVRKRRHLHEPLLHRLYEIIIEMRGIGRLLNLCQIQTSNVEFSLISLPDHPFCLVFWILNKNRWKILSTKTGARARAQAVDHLLLVVTGMEYILHLVTE